LKVTYVYVFVQQATIFLYKIQVKVRAINPEVKNVVLCLLLINPLNHIFWHRLGLGTVPHLA